ncbi:MAG: hypothetical protein WD066_07815 [Planctomycetaceae bacterium]
MDEFNRDPNYSHLLNALIEKTKAGKLSWEETADEFAFLAAVGGRQTFEIAHRKVRDPLTGELTRLPVLTVRGEDGRLLFETSGTPSEAATELYALARRAARNEDVRVKESLELIQNL